VQPSGIAFSVRANLWPDLPKNTSGKRHLCNVLVAAVSLTMKARPDGMPGEIDGMVGSRFGSNGARLTSNPRAKFKLFMTS
jgi:hypothetical protein